PADATDRRPISPQPQGGARCPRKGGGDDAARLALADAGTVLRTPDRGAAETAGPPGQGGGRRRPRPGTGSGGRGPSVGSRPGRGGRRGRGSRCDERGGRVACEGRDRGAGAGAVAEWRDHRTGGDRAPG